MAQGREQGEMCGIEVAWAVAPVAVETVRPPPRRRERTASMSRGGSSREWLVPASKEMTSFAVGREREKYLVEVWKLWAACEQ